VRQTRERAQVQVWQERIDQDARNKDGGHSRHYHGKE